MEFLFCDRVKTNRQKKNQAIAPLCHCMFRKRGVVTLSALQHCATPENGAHAGALAHTRVFRVDCVCAGRLSNMVWKVCEKPQGADNPPVAQHPTNQTSNKSQTKQQPLHTSPTTTSYPTPLMPSVFIKS